MMKFSGRQKIIAWVRIAIIKMRSSVTFGKNVYVGRNCAITGLQSLAIGSDVYIGKNVTIEVDGLIGNKILIANNVGIVGRRDHDVKFGMPAFDADVIREHPRLSTPLHIGDGVWVGFGAIILSGVRIGENAIIAAGAVVVNDVPANCIAKGNPAVIYQRR